MKRNHSVPFVCFSCAATAPIGPADWPAGDISSTDKTPTTARTFSAAGLPVRITPSPAGSQWKIGTQKSRSILSGKNPKTSNQVRSIAIINWLFFSVATFNCNYCAIDAKNMFARMITE